MLRHTRLAAIVSLPRFTFKSSGADVSASILYLEKRSEPLEKLSDDVSYQFAAELIENVGLDAGNKKSASICKRNQKDGSLIIDEHGSPIIDCDFDDVIKRIVASDPTNCFNWISKGNTVDSTAEGWAINIENIYNDSDLTMEPKRLWRKVVKLRKALLEKPHLLLEDIVDFIPERQAVLDGILSQGLDPPRPNWAVINDAADGDILVLFGCTCDIWQMERRCLEPLPNSQTAILLSALPPYFIRPLVCMGRGYALRWRR